MNAPASHDVRNTPDVQSAHFVHVTRYMTFGAFPTGSILKLDVPKGMARRRVYVGIVPSTLAGFPTYPTVTGQVIFRLAGNVVLRLPFNRSETGRVSVRPGCEARSAVAGVATYSGFQPPPPAALLLQMDNVEHSIPPFAVRIHCDSIELTCESMDTSEENLAAVLGCHSEGFSE